MEPTARKNNYLRAMPYRSPEEQAAEADRLRALSAQLAARAARLRHWAFGLAAVAAGAAVLMVAAVSLLLPRAGTASSTPIDAGQQAGATQQVKKNSAPPATNNAPGAPTPAISLPAPAAGAAAGNASIKSLPAPAKDAKVFAPALPKPSGDLTHKEILLEALGGLSAAHLYQSYLNIGLLADGVESKAYSSDEARNTLGVIANFMDLVEGKLTKLERASLDPEDQDSLSRIKAVTGLLRLQTKTLLAYWDSGDMEQADQYHAARKAAWSGLSKVLGLEGE